MLGAVFYLVFFILREKRTYGIFSVETKIENISRIVNVCMRQFIRLVHLFAFL